MHEIGQAEQFAELDVTSSISGVSKSFVFMLCNELRRLGGPDTFAFSSMDSLWGRRPSMNCPDRIASLETSSKHRWPAVAL